MYLEFHSEVKVFITYIDQIRQNRHFFKRKESYTSASNCYLEKNRGRVICRLMNYTEVTFSFSRAIVSAGINVHPVLRLCLKSNVHCILLEIHP